MSKDLLGERVYLPGQGGRADQELPVAEQELATSGRDLEVIARYPILRGLDLPTQAKGALSPLDEERWIIAIEVLLQRGVSSLTELSQLTGLSVARADKFVKEVKERWSKSLTAGQVNARREAIYLEAERVKQACWETLENLDGNDLAKLAYLKMIIECGKRQSALIGAERINVSVETTASHKSAADMERELAKQLKIPIEDLANIGDTISKQLSNARSNTDDE
jgi:hypothetical protein